MTKIETYRLRRGDGTVPHPVYFGGRHQCLSATWLRKPLPLSDSLLIEEVEGLALVAGQLLQGAALLLDRRLHLRGGGVVLDVDRCLHRRLLGCSTG